MTQCGDRRRAEASLRTRSFIALSSLRLVVERVAMSECSKVLPGSTIAQHHLDRWRSTRIACPPIRRGQQDVSVGGEFHDEFSAKTRNRPKLLLRSRRSSRFASRFPHSACQTARASSQPGACLPVTGKRHLPFVPCE